MVIITQNLSHIRLSPHKFRTLMPVHNAITSIKYDTTVSKEGDGGGTDRAPVLYKGAVIDSPSKSRDSLFIINIRASLLWEKHSAPLPYSACNINSSLST